MHAELEGSLPGEPDPLGLIASLPPRFLQGTQLLPVLHRILVQTSKPKGHLALEFLGFQNVPYRPESWLAML